MILTFEIFGRARNHGKKFLKLCQTSFSGIVHWVIFYHSIILTNFSFQDMIVVTTAAERSIEDILSREDRLLTRDPGSVTMESDPSPMYGWVLNAEGNVSRRMGEMSAKVFKLSG